MSSEHRLCSNDFETTVWITDPDVEFRRATILEEQCDHVIVGFHDENGHFEKVVIINLSIYIKKNNAGRKK